MIARELIRISIIVLDFWLRHLWLMYSCKNKIPILNQTATIKVFFPLYSTRKLDLKGE